MKITAIREIDEFTNPWKPFNKLFNKYIPYLEIISNNGATRISKENYVKRNDDYELHFFNNKIVNYKNLPVNKIELIVGKVGAGKTTFIDHIREELIPSSGLNIFPIYIDTKSIPKNLKREEVVDLIERRIYLSIETDLILKYFDRIPYKFKRKFVKHIGVPNPTKQEVISIYNQESTLSNMMLFLDNTSFVNEINKLVIFFDNVDENSRKIIRHLRYQANEINSFLREYSQKLDSVVFLAVRNYNRKKYFSTNRYEPNFLPQVNELLVAQSKITELRDLISESAQPQLHTYTKTKKPFQDNASYVIDKRNIVEVLNNVIELAFKDESNNSPFRLIKDISAGNLKFVVSNIFNFLLSYNLPINELYDDVIDSVQTSTSERSPITLNVMTNCLLAIHYPFFDSINTNLINLYSAFNNVRWSTPFDTMVILRILFLLDHNSQLTLNKIYNKLSKVGYPKKYIKQGIFKCYDKGIFETTNGVDIKHLDKEKDMIKLSSSGTRYITDLFFRISYLQSISENVYMPSKLVVSLKDKYKHKQGQINMVQNRLKSVKNFIKFIEIQESQEVNKVMEFTEWKSEIEYLNEYSINSKGTGIRVSTYLKDKVLPFIETLEYGEKYRKH